VTGGKLVEGYGLTEASPVTHGNPLSGTIKEGIGIPFPDTDSKIVDMEDASKDLPQGEVGELAVRGPQVMEALRASRGEAVAVGEGEIGGACRDLARLGFYVEPSGAVAAAGLRSVVERGTWEVDGTVVVVLTGSGLKTPDRLAALLAEFGADP